MSEKLSETNRGQKTNTKEHGQAKADFRPSAQDLRRLEKSSASIKKVLQRQTQDALEVGRLLVAAKADLDHGYFLNWIDNELPFGRRMGQVYMRIHSALADHATVVGGFGVSTLNALSAKALGDEHRTTVLSEVKSGTLKSDEAVLERLRNLVAPDRIERAMQLQADRAAARKKAALVTYELAGERVSEIIELLRAAGLPEFADTLEEVFTEPNVSPGGAASDRSTPASSTTGHDSSSASNATVETDGGALRDFLAPLSF
jgi:hypothetical protein